MKDELRNYRIRAHNLKQLGLEASNSIECRSQARSEYSALKNHFAERLKELTQKRCEHEDIADYHILLDAVRQGYRTMRASHNANPVKRVWMSSVQALYSQMDYHVGLLDVELDELERNASDLLKMSSANMRDFDFKVNNILNLMIYQLNPSSKPILRKKALNIS